MIAMIRKTNAQLNIIVSDLLWFETVLLQPFDHLLDLVLAFTKLLLQPAKQLIVLTLSKNQIIVCQIAVALFQLPFDFVPGAFELQFVHNC
jgi:hypothetical protein